MTSPPQLGTVTHTESDPRAGTYANCVGAGGFFS